MLQKNAKKQKFHHLFAGKTPLMLNKCPPKSNNFHAVPAASTASPYPTIIGLVLWFYNNMQTEWQLCRPLSD